MVAQYCPKTSILRVAGVVPEPTGISRGIEVAKIDGLQLGAAFTFTHVFPVPTVSQDMEHTEHVRKQTMLAGYNAGKLTYQNQHRLRHQPG